MKFLPLIDLRIRHAYYVDGRCNDFSIDPSAATQRLLINYRCIVRHLPDGLSVNTAAVDSAQPFLPLPQGENLVFHLRATNPEFPLFTDLAGFADNMAPVFTTKGASGKPMVLKLSARTATQTERLVFPAEEANAEFALGGQPLAGAPGAAYLVNGLDGVPTVSPGKTEQRITVQAEAKPSARPFTVTYPVRPQLPPGIFADVEIQVGTVETACVIQFQARQAYCRYYLITGPTLTADSYSIVSSDKFTASDVDPADSIGLALQNQSVPAGGVQVKCFTSDAQLPVGPSVPRDLQFQQGNSKSTERLAVPPVRNMCLVNDQTAFFQIIRKTANP